MRQPDKSLQSEKFKQVVGGLGKPLGKSPAPDRIQSPRNLDRSFPSWPGSGYFGTAPGGVLYTAEGPRPFQLSDPRPPQAAALALRAAAERQAAEEEKAASVHPQWSEADDAAAAELSAAARNAGQTV